MKVDDIGTENSSQLLKVAGALIEIISEINQQLSKKKSKQQYLFVYRNLDNGPKTKLKKQINKKKNPEKRLHQTPQCSVYRTTDSMNSSILFNKTAR